MQPTLSPVPTGVTATRPIIPLISFIAITVLVQLVPWYAMLILLLITVLCAVVASPQQRKLWIVNSMYIIGHAIYHYLHLSYFPELNVPRELKVVLSRLSLLGFLLPFFLWLVMDKPKVNYLVRGKFTNIIHTPLIWRGIKDPIWRFLLIAITVMTVSFLPVIDFSRENLLQLLGYGLMFAIINSILEELLWRGALLSRLVNTCGEVVGLIISSIGFGLYHYSLGFSWIICMLFSICGMLLGGVAIRSAGLVPVIVLHAWMNMLFVLSGLIF